MVKIECGITCFRRPEHVLYTGLNQKGRSVFFNPLAPDWIAVDDTIALFLALCDGCRSMDEIANLFHAEDPSRNDLERIATQLASNGWLEPAVTGGQSAASKTPERDTPLSSICLYVTANCNLSCRYCFYDAASSNSPDTLTTEDFTNVIDQVSGSTVSKMVFLGGEPLLRSDICRIGRYALDKGIHSQLVTNGTLIDELNVEEIAEAFASIQISLDGLQEEHETIRGKGSFERTLRGIRLLLRKRSDLCISCMISRLNVHTLDDFLEFLYEKGIRHVHFTRLLMAGRGRTGTRHTISEKAFYTALAGLEMKWASLIHLDQYKALCNVANKPKRLCGVGNGTLEIDHRGDIYPCYRFMESKYRLGNIRTETPLLLHGKSGIISQLRCKTVETDANCHDCSIRLLCGGGCLADRIEMRVDHDECEQKRAFWRDFMLSDEKT